MSRRIFSTAALLAAILSSFWIVSGVALGDCPPNATNLANGAGLFATKCAACHGPDPGKPCDPEKVFDPSICWKCSIDPTTWANRSLYGASKTTLQGFAEGTETMNSLTVEETKDIFKDLTPQDFNDLAAFLASKDPRTYSVKGTIQGGAPFANPVMEVCSEYNPSFSSATSPASFKFAKLNDTDLAYTITGVRAGSYSIQIKNIGLLAIFFPLEPFNGEFTRTFQSTSPPCSMDIPDQSVDFGEYSALFDLLIRLKTEIMHVPTPPCLGRPCPPLKVILATIQPPLTVLLNQAMRQLAADSKKDAIDSLRQFQQQTRQFMRQGLISDTQGRVFISEAQAIIEHIISGRTTVRLR